MRLKIYLTLVMGAILVISVASGIPMSSSEEEIVLVRDADDSERTRTYFERFGEVIDLYNNYALMRVSEDQIPELEKYHQVDALENRNKIFVNRYQFDTNEGYPELNSDLFIEEYEKGTSGIYIVDLIGPVNPEWRYELEKTGVEIINYVPNYAYEVIMTPEQAEEVEELSFVDWVGIYQPQFKLSRGLEPGLLEVTLANGEKRIMSANHMNQIVELANREEVYYISQFVEPVTHAEMDTQITGGGLWFWDPEDEPTEPYRDDGPYGSLANQLGYEGEDIIIGFADTGFSEHVDFQDRIIGGAEYDGEEWNQGMEYVSEDSHGTHVAGIAAANTYEGTGMTVDTWLEEDEDISNPDMGEYYAGQGAAPSAYLYFQQVIDHEGLPNDTYEIPEKAKGEDVFIHSNSWGLSEYEGEYTEESSSYDEAVRDSLRDEDGNRPMIITVSAGNTGLTKDHSGDVTRNYESITPPSTAKNVITVGATETFNEDLKDSCDYFDSNPESIMDLEYELGNPAGSSRGWTEDGRVKPDVVAPGQCVISTQEVDEYGLMSGTSMSAPNGAGQAAVVTEWYEDYFDEKPSPAMVKTFLINTAEPLESVYPRAGGPIPNREMGWGIVNLANLMNEGHSNFFVDDQNTLLETGESKVYTIEPQDTNEPLKISLVWTDNEASPGDSYTLENDLNLEVENPSGQIIRGNAFDKDGDGWSDDGYTYPEADVMDDFDSNDNGWDNRNNVQNVYLHPDEVNEGTYTIRVHGNNIVADSNNDGSNNQDYSLVARNAEDSDKYELSINVLGEGTTDPSPGTYLYSSGEEVSLNAWPTDPNWEFSHWDGDYYSTTSSITIVMDDHKSLTAYFVLEGFDSYSVSSEFSSNDYSNSILRDERYILNSSIYRYYIEHQNIQRENLPRTTLKPN